jgi:hypothetical protein
VGRVLERDAEVLEHGHARERLRDLEAPHDAEPRPLVRRELGDVAALEQDPAAVRRQGARHAIDERGLAGAVGADETQPIARPDLNRDAVERQEAAEALGDAVDVEERPPSSRAPLRASARGRSALRRQHHEEHEDHADDQQIELG